MMNIMLQMMQEEKEKVLSKFYKQNFSSWNNILS